jgi:O-antigen polymerase
LQNGVEGGIVGLLLFGSLLVSLLFLRKKITGNNLKGITAHAGVVAFVVMALFNFTIEAVPVMCLFLIYSALLATVAGSRPVIKIVNKQKSWMLSAGIIALAMFIGISQLKLATASTDGQYAARLSKQGNNISALSLLSALENKLAGSVTYLSNYANALYADKKYAEAAEQLTKAIAIQSTPEMYVLLGYCYQATGKINDAVEKFKIARDMVPGRLLPRFALMQVYLNTNDTDNAKKIAAEVMSIQPKVISKETTFYKQEALRIMNL